MEKTPEYALEAGIAVWTADNQDIVRCALQLAEETTALGLVDTSPNKHLFKQFFSFSNFFFLK